MKLTFKRSRLYFTLWQIVLDFESGCNLFWSKTELFLPRNLNSQYS